MSDLPPSNSYPLPPTSYDYQSEGGALLLDAPTYVKRQADDDLYEGLKAGQFCYVLNARQMGKSSLKVRTLQRLRDEGVACAAVDLQGIGTTATEEQWYFGIISRIARSLGLHRQLNLNTWWTEQPRLSYVQRFVEFLESLLLPAVASPIVIFIDEVDLTLNLAFRDDFFGALRESYNRRADEPEYRRLTFALFGVTTPSDLIQNKQTTPFNIGRPVDLTGLHLEEAQPLIPGLVAKASNPQALLQAVLDWTGGQPFLTQKLCKLVQSAESAPLDGQENQWVEQLVQAKVIDNWEAQDIPPHLKTIRDRLLLSGEQRTGRLLGLYQQIVQQGELAADDSPEQVELRLTGLVVKRDGKLRVYNRIYEQVFNRDWLERSLAELRPYGGAIAAWLESNPQDESRLLRGQALQDARTWAEGKSLGDDDRRFLDASQELEKRDIQKKFDLEAEEKRILANANQKANRRIRFGSIALVSMLAIAIASGIAAQQRIGAADQKVKESKGEAEKFQGEAEKFQGEATKAEVEKKDAEEKTKQATQNLRTAELRVAVAKQQVEAATTQIEQAKQEREQAQLSAAQAKQGKEQADIAAMQARQQEDVANTQVALAKAELSKVGELEIASRVESANTLFELDQRLKGLLESLRAAARIKILEATSPVNSETKFGAAIALSQAVYGTRDQNVIPVLPSDYPGSIKFSPRDTMIAYTETGGYENLRGRVSVWNLNGKEIGNFQDRGIKFFSPNEKTILLTLFDRKRVGGTLKNINMGFGDFSISGLDGTTRETPSGQLLAVNEEKGLFAVFHEKRSIQIWDLNSSSLKATLPLVNYKIDRSFFNPVFSPDGQSIAVIDESLKKITLWNINSNETQTFEGSDISFSPDGKIVAVVTKEYNEVTSQFQLRNVDGRVIKDLEGAEVNFSPSSKMLAGIIRWQESALGEKPIALGEKPIKLWSIDGTELKTFQGYAYEFSPDGSIIAITDSKGIHLWKTTGEKVFTFENAQQIVFSPDSKVVAIENYGETKVYTPLGENRRSVKGTNAKFSPNSKILVLDLSDDRDKFVNLETGHEEVVSSRGDIRFTQGSSLMAFVSSNNTLRIMGPEPASKPVLLADRNSTFLVSPKTILVTKDKTLEFWNTVGQKVRSISVNSADYRYGFNKDGSVVYVVSDANPNEIWLFNDSGNLLRKLSEHTDKISRIEVSPDGQTIASLSQDGTIRSWNIYSGRALKTFSTKGSSFISFTGANTLISPFWDDSKKKEVVRILDVNSGKESTSTEFDLSQLADEKSGLRIDGKYNRLWFGDRVAVILKDGTLKVQKIDGQILLESKTYKTDLKFSSDNRKIAFLNKSYNVEIWDLTQQTQTILNAEVYAKTPRQIREDGLPTVYFDDFDFSPNSQMIVASYMAITGKGATQINPPLFDVNYKNKTLILDAKGIAILEDLNSQVSDIAFSPKGEILASYFDGSIDLWSLSNRKKQKKIGVFKPGQGGKNLSGNLSQNIRFTPDGKAIIYSNGGQSFLWNFDLDYLMSTGCDWLYDYLTNNPTASESDRQMCGIASKK